MNQAILTNEQRIMTSCEGIREVIENPGGIWLDSSKRVSDKGKHSFLAREPLLELRLNGSLLERMSAEGSTTSSVCNDFIEYVQNMLHGTSLTAIGYFGYESLLSFHKLKTLPANKSNTPIPDAAFFIYDNISEIEAIEDEGASQRDLNPDHSAYLVEVALDRDGYNKAFDVVHKHIREGDIYQANLTNRFVYRSEARPETIFFNLRNLNPSPYGAYLNFGDFQILSSSPERMIHFEDGIIRSCPIKGTAPRGSDAQSDRANLERLVKSSKDRAELLMIVDLLRNDIGRVAQTGSVTVHTIYHPERYSSLYHLTSEISAQIKNGVTMSELLKAIMPGGSITGAPKRSAIEILHGVEPAARSVYTGCIGMMTATSVDFNIAIRTMVHRDNLWYIWAGGGVVADSTAESEYEELLLKAKNLNRALGVSK